MKIKVPQVSQETLERLNAACESVRVHLAKCGKQLSKQAKQRHNEAAKRLAATEWEKVRKSLTEKYSRNRSNCNGR